MAEGNILDIAHISFLDMIKVMISSSGAANAKGTLIRNALNTAGKMQEVEYGSFDDFVGAIDDTSNPITQIEGKATHMGDFVFGLANCPFSPSIKNYTKIFEKMPEGYADFTAEFNKSSMITDKYRVGEGAGVSPFCAVHQPMRSAVAEKIKIGGKNIEIFQLGCKSGAGAKGFSDKWIEATGIAKDVVDKVLDNNMCCYYVKVMD
jgi:hypothetical protein